MTDGEEKIIRKMEEIHQTLRHLVSGQDSIAGIHIRNGEKKDEEKRQKERDMQREAYARKEKAKSVWWTIIILFGYLLMLLVFRGNL